MLRREPEARLPFFWEGPDLPDLKKGSLTGYCEEWFLVYFMLPLYLYNKKE